MPEARGIPTSGGAHAGTTPTLSPSSTTRYELEFGRGRCPVLKAVLQHDEPAAQCMVLAVMRATPGDAAVRSGA